MHNFVQIFCCEYDKTNIEKFWPLKILTNIFHYNLTICNLQYQISEAVLVPKTTGTTDSLKRRRCTAIFHTNFPFPINLSNIFWKGALPPQPPTKTFGRGLHYLQTCCAKILRCNIYIKFNKQANV